MTPERWQQIDELLQEAIKRPRRDRAAFLDEVCADDVSRREVESLISFHEQAENFLEVPAFEEAAGLLADQESLVGLSVGPYKIERLLGAGGMGEVYLAEDTKLDRRVAIKFLPASLEADEVAKRRLIREARAAAKLEHPNICGTYEVGEDANRSFIVMQYVQGESLASKIQRQPLELWESLDVAIQVADALAEAHSYGIIHRDIKPQNIMITPRGQVKVLDFGLAKLVRSASLTQLDAQQQSVLSAPGLVVGTAPYMSPEQAKGIESVDVRSDLFSIGVVLYESIAGRLPFSGSSSIEICSQVLHFNPPPPSQFNSHIPPALDALTIKALAKDPDARYQSAAELLEDLRAVSLTPPAEDHVLTKPIPSRARTSSIKALTTLSHILRQPRMVFISVLAALTIALVLFFVARIVLRPAPRPPPAEAVRWYIQGTGALRDGLYFRASNALQNAVNASGDFALARARLAEAMAELDYDNKASSEILRARSLVPDLSVLPPLDALYLQAVTYMATRDFEHAVQSYQEIVRKSQDSEKAYAYVDLGRAYEKDDQIDKAIESYENASELAPDDPAAFLRLGILYSRKQNTESAEEAFQKAHTLYQTLSNLEGVTEVLYQRGVASNNFGKLAEARTRLQEALDLARDNKHQQIRILLQLSQAWNAGGKRARAQQYVNEAITAAQASEMSNLSTQGLLVLGKVLQSDHNDLGAEKAFTQALESAQLQNGWRNKAMAELSLGTLRIVVHHDAEGGLSFIERALQFFEPGGYRKEVSESLIQMARARCLKRDYDAALDAYAQVLQLAERIGDASLFARAHADTGNLLNQQERYTEALGHLEKSSAIYSSLDNQLNTGYSLADRADALWRLGRYDEAREVLSQASAMVDESDTNQWLRAKILLIDTYLALSERRFLDAREKARKAVRLNTEKEPEVDASYALGIATSLSGNKHEGRLICEEAVEKARGLHDPQILPNALLALAEVMLEEGELRPALATALEAQDLLARANRKESEWRAWLLAGRASRNSGEAATEREYISRAAIVLAGLESRWGAQAYNGYLTRPDVQYYRQQLGRALKANN